jgi:hypothetical protein
VKIEFVLLLLSICRSINVPICLERSDNVTSKLTMLGNHTKTSQSILFDGKRNYHHNFGETKVTSLPVLGCGNTSLCA